MSSQYPHFIQENLVYSCDFHLNRKHRSRLAFLRNLQLYELRNKQVLFSINLCDSILQKVQSKLDSISPELNEIHSQASDILSSSISCSLGGIVVGKYIYQNRLDKKVYIILKCWDSMVVIRKDLEGFTLQAEYEGVHSFKISKDSKYQNKLAISYVDGEQTLTNFQENQIQTDLPTVDEYKKLVERIKIKQSELLVHKSITKKEFARLKSSELFGCNFIRSPRLEEMQILSKCSDAWVKVTADDNVVIGVPLVNNCSTRLTVLKNMRCVLQCHGNGDLSYIFSLYQLNVRFSDIENITSFFESQENNSSGNYCWSQCTDFCLRPDAFCVLILSLKLNELIDFGAVQLLLFIFYDIVISERKFSQKCFLTTLAFREIFSNDTYKINFHEKHLHRDLLTVIATSYEADILLEFSGNGMLFEEYLCNRMDFFRICNQTHSETMNIDDQAEDSNQTAEKNFFYNKNPNTLWHGTLLALAFANESCSELKLYTKTQEKSKAFFKFLHMELRIKCGIKEIRSDNQSSFTKLIGFEAALRDEFDSHLRTCSKSASLDTKKKQILELHLSQLKTDMLLKDLES